MEKIQSQQSEDDNQSVDAFTSVMGPEHSGRMRLYERGVTKTSLKGKGNFRASLSANDEMMNKKMEEMEERMHQRMEEKLQQQKTTICQEVTVDILTRLKHMYPGLPIDADMLAALCAQPPGEGTSVPQAIFQPSNRPSAGSTNQGRENEEEEDECIEDLT
ncbi:uncharacterized protein LOC132036346 [Lycium ferocissimum]|uniref:uncharacterized protein LOC132036346 n=1 Tax=Lycium ferocissimum TaxID=112874 RepID=UPI00281564FB|nr:uncharacterized protein LOC132036346 [Lycium ferocissimum]